MVLVLFGLAKSPTMELLRMEEDNANLIDSIFVMVQLEWVQLR